jgi:dienelactone hydrolase
MRRKLVALLVAALMIPAGTAVAAQTQLSLPRPTGPYPVGTAELHLVDSERMDPWSSKARELMISLSYPAWPSARPVAKHMKPGVADFYDKNSGAVGITPGMADFAGTRTHTRIGAPAIPGDRPVIIYSPGGGNSRSMGTTLVEDLVSRGYLVVTIDHTFTGPVEFPGRFEGLGRGVDNAKVMQERAKDTSFVLDQLAARGIDLSRVGMFGHSMGGFTTAETMLTDRRIDAGINLDGSMDPRAGQASSKGADRPFLLMGGGLSSNVPHNHQHSDDWGAFWANSTGWKRDVYLPTAEHMSFADTQLLLAQINRQFPLPQDKLAAAIGTVDPQRSIAIQRTYIAAFFALHLRGQQTTLFDKTVHPEVQLIK